MESFRKFSAPLINSFTSMVCIAQDLHMLLTAKTYESTYSLFSVFVGGAKSLDC